MTRSDAERRARELQADGPERDTHRFVARESAGGDWEVVKVRLPEAIRRKPLTETVDAAPRPSPAEDPRSGHEQRAPGYPGGIF